MDSSLIQRRKIAYKLNKWDDIDLPFFVDYNDVASQVIQFFKTKSELIYPAKSYFVAIVYAKCLEKYFKKDFYKSLDDKDLLVDDKYFKPYSDDLETYDKILDALDDILEYQSVNKTVEYFKKEFMVESEKSLWSL